MEGYTESRENTVLTRSEQRSERKRKKLEKARVRLASLGNNESSGNGNYSTEELTRRVLGAVKTSIDHVHQGHTPGVKLRGLVQQLGNVDAGQVTRILTALETRGILASEGKGIYNALIEPNSDAYRQLEIMLLSVELENFSNISPNSVAKRLRIDPDLAELYLDSLTGGPIKSSNGSYFVDTSYWR